MTSQIPTFRLTVARQMAAYRQRLAERIDRELQRRGQDAGDLAYALKVSPRTAERWVAGTTEPQRRLRKPIADYLDVAIEELWPDLEAEEHALRDQLNRMERELAAIGEVVRAIAEALAVSELEQAAAEIESAAGGRQDEGLAGSGQARRATASRRARAG